VARRVAKTTDESGGAASARPVHEALAPWASDAGYVELLQSIEKYRSACESSARRSGIEMGLVFTRRYGMPHDAARRAL
jgi:hypothetical protein